MYRNHAERLWAAEKWREEEAEKIKQEKLAKQQGIVGRFWKGVLKSKENVELAEEDLSTEVLLERAARQKPTVEKPVLRDSHRKKDAEGKR
jgi:hypothetical protein